MIKNSVIIFGIFDAHNYSFVSAGKYRVTRRYKLNLNNNAQIDSVIQGLFKIGINRVWINNVISHKIEEKKAEASLKAFDIAKARAQKLCSHMNCILGNIIEVTEIYPNYNNSNAYRSRLSMIMGEGDILYKPQLRKIEIHYIIEVKFEIE